MVADQRIGAVGTLPAEEGPVIHRAGRVMDRVEAVLSAVIVRIDRVPDGHVPDFRRAGDVAHAGGIEGDIEAP